MDDTPTMSDAPISRRERRELHRMQRRSEQGRSAFRRSVRRFLIWGGGLALLVAFGWLMTKLAGNVPLPADAARLAVPVSASDNTIGPADAPVTLVEYSDFQCPACAAFAPVVKQTLADAELAGRVRSVYRHFPLTNIHTNAQLAAQAAQAAGKQGKFWEMHDMLFEKQRAWSGMSSAGARTAFLGYAAALSLDTGAFQRDLESDAVKEKVADDLASAIASNVNSTPTFFLNGAKMAHPASPEEFKQSIIAALASVSVPPASASVSPDAAP